MSRNYWLHRISCNRELSYPLLDNGILTIGFSDFSSKDNLFAIQNDDTNFILEKLCSDNGWGTFSPNRDLSLKRFIEMKNGDWVVVPFIYGKFGIYEVIDDRANCISEIYLSNIKDWYNRNVYLSNGLLYIEGGKEALDLGFFRKVRAVDCCKTLSRSDFTDTKLYRRLKVRQTTINISDLQESINNTVERAKKNNPINLYSALLDTALPTITTIIETTINSDVKFEQLIRAYFKALGADVFTPAKNEYAKENSSDADIIATFESTKTTYYIQAKFHDENSETDDWGVKQVKEYVKFKGRMDDDYSRIAWVISFARDFTQEAKNLAIENDIRLINRYEFIRMLSNIGFNKLRDLK